MKISIVGWFGMNNVGDDAFQVVFSELLSEHEIEFIRPPQTCNSPDIVILGGGAVASPFYLKILPDCPRYALGIDIAYKSEIDLLATANFKDVYVRNNTDVAEMIEKMGCPVLGIPDLAFLMKPSGQDILSKYKKFPAKKTLGVLVTDYVNPAIDRSIGEFSERAYSFILAMADELDGLANAGYEIILIPCSTGGYGDDRRINLDLAAFMKSRPISIFDTLGPQDMIDLIADLDVTICQRFHAHIFSIIAGTPFVSIDFTRKVKLLLEENQMLHHSGAKFEGNKFNVSNLRDTFDHVASMNRSKWRNDLQTIANGYHSELTNLMTQLKQDWLR